jgi:hypothetical protein
VLINFSEEGETMSIWARIAVTIILMVLISFLAGIVWSNLFSSQIPSYISGLIGGLVAVPAWEILERFKAAPEKKK